MNLIAKIIFFVIFSSAFFVRSQTYHSFPDSNAIWNTVGDNVFTNAQYEFRFGLSGDTVINSISYSKVYRLFDTTLINPNSSYFGAIREDFDRKVYFLKPGYAETLLYDFSAQIGDTIWYQIGGACAGDTFAFWPQTPHYLVVSDIDSILLENNEYRKKWNLNGEFMADSWVEGIGSISWFGLFNPFISDIALSGDGYSFACFRQNYETIYLDNVNCGTCYCNIILSYDDILDNRDNALSILPNPAENEMGIIFLNADGPYNVQILNMTGQNVYTRTEVREHYIKIPLSTLQSGQYILFVSDEKNSIVSEGKFIIK